MTDTALLGDLLVLVATALASMSVAGVLRFSRLHAKIHAGAVSLFAVVLALLACAAASGAHGARALLVVALLVATAPVSAHAVARLESRRLARDAHADRRAESADE